VIEVFKDLRKVGVSILTLGQYLRPSDNHAVMTRYYHPDEFRELEAHRVGIGIRARRSRARWCRSSYHAHEQADAAARHSQQSRVGG
jgi:lipoic acid synthetase